MPGHHVVDAHQPNRARLCAFVHQRPVVRAAQRYQVPAHEILQRVGEAGYVGGQEDMIIDIALQLAAERERAMTDG